MLARLLGGRVGPCLLAGPCQDEPSEAQEEAVREIRLLFQVPSLPSLPLFLGAFPLVPPLLSRQPAHQARGGLCPVAGWLGPQGGFRLSRAGVWQPCSSGGGAGWLICWVRSEHGVDPRAWPRDSSILGVRLQEAPPLPSVVSASLGWTADPAHCPGLG